MDKKKEIIAIVQARMGSTRLPGKVLMDIVGKPMLWHIVNRLSYCNLINKIIVATCVSQKDDAIEDFCKRNNIVCYRGSQDDVLDRYYQAAKTYKPDAVVRITADCPLIDAKVVDMIVSAYCKNCARYDGASNVIKRTYPRGLDTEVVSFQALERASREAKKNYEREHVTVYLYEHPELFKLYSIEHCENLSDLRWTVDEESDLLFVREVYERLFRKGEVFFTKDILKVLKEEPRLKEINKDVDQKTIR